MKKFLASLGLAAILAGATLPIGSSYAAQSSRSMSVKILAPTSRITITSTRSVTLKLKVRGITLDLKHMGKKLIAGHGHIQVYLDRIPKDAYKKVDTADLVVVAGTSSFAFQVSKPWVRLHKGKHHLIVALAKNNNVLYHSATASIAATVK